MTTSGSGDLRVGVVGVGMMGADHAERIAHRIAGARLVAVNDYDPERARQVAAGFVGVRAFDDPIALIADDEIDAVLLASPGSVHEEQLLAALKAGTWTLCEKPLTMDTESAIRVLEAEHGAGQARIQVGFMRRFDPEYAEMKQLLGSGKLGRILLAHNTHRNKQVPPGFASEMIVRDSLVHEVDVARWLFDEEIVEITVLAPSPTSAAADGVLDPQVALFRMAGGAIVTNEVFVTNQVGYEVRCEAVAERGSVMVGRTWSGLYITAAGEADGAWGGHIPVDFRDRFARAYDLQVQAWVNACRRGEVIGATAWDGYASTAVCTAGMASLAAGGTPVAVELIDHL